MVFGTADEFPNLVAAKPSDAEAEAAQTEWVLRVIWHLQLNGFQAGQQRNQSGTISRDKITIMINGRWNIYDLLGAFGAGGVPAQVQFALIGSPGDGNYLPNPGIPD